MKIVEQQSLKSYNTFGLDVQASRFAVVTSAIELSTFLKKNIDPLFILGGGSNMLLTQDIKALVLKNEIKGIEVIRTFKDTVHIAVGGGENWHQFVLWTIREKLGGIENLSLIPGDSWSLTNSEYRSLWCRVKRRFCETRSN